LRPPLPSPEFSDKRCSPNAEEALGLLSMPFPVTQLKIEEAAAKFLDYGVGDSGKGSVVIRSGTLGAYVVSRTAKGRWVEAFWGLNDLHRVVDVTGTRRSRHPQHCGTETWIIGAGNAFLGGLGAGLRFTRDIYEGIPGFEGGQWRLVPAHTFDSRTLCHRFRFLHHRTGRSPCDRA